MTISGYIVNWIKEFENIKIEMNHVQDGSDKYGLFKSPNRDIISNIDGSYTAKEYYQFLVKQANTSDYDRKDSDEWLEELTYWVDDYPFNYDYPSIDGNRTVRKIELTGCPYPMESNDSETTYQISLSITYDREREEL